LRPGDYDYDYETKGHAYAVRRPTGDDNKLSSLT